jgi:hypothetical protein
MQKLCVCLTKAFLAGLLLYLINSTKFTPYHNVIRAINANAEHSSTSCCEPPREAKAKSVTSEFFRCPQEIKPGYQGKSCAGSSGSLGGCTSAGGAVSGGGGE